MHCWLHPCLPTRSVGAPDLLNACACPRCAAETTKLPLQFPNAEYDQARWLRNSCFRTAVSAAAAAVHTVVALLLLLLPLLLLLLLMLLPLRSCPLTTPLRSAAAGVHDLLHGGPPGIPHHQPRGVQGRRRRRRQQQPQQLQQLGLALGQSVAGLQGEPAAAASVSWELGSASWLLLWHHQVSVGRGSLVFGHTLQVVSEDIRDFEYTPKPEFEGEGQRLQGCTVPGLGMRLSVNHVATLPARSTRL